MANSREIQLAAQIRDAGRRMTKARMALIECLQRAGPPLTHKQIARLLRDQGFEQTTVWRNLTMLVEMGLVHRRELGDHLWRYELAQEASPGGGTAAVYFCCLTCSALAPVQGVISLPLLGTTLPGVGQVSEALLRGICCDCSQGEPAAVSMRY